jgi:hypothetical protein
VERSRSAIALAAVAVVLVVIIVTLIVLEPWKEEPTLAKRAIIRPENISETDWMLHGEYDDSPHHEGASSFCEVCMNTTNVTAYVFVYAFGSAELAKNHFEYRLGNFTYGLAVEPIEAGDQGALIMHMNGNGSLSLFIYQENLFVWMDLLSEQDGGELVNDTCILDRAWGLVYAQEQKFSSVLSP